MIVPSGHFGGFGKSNYDSSYSHSHMPSQSWYNQSCWQNNGNGGRNMNAWGVSKPPRDRSQYQFSYQADGEHVGGQMNCGNQFCCGATVSSDGANCWPVPVASDMPNAFNMIMQMCHSYFDYFEQTQEQMHKQCSRLAHQVAQTQDSLATFSNDMFSRPQFNSGRGFQDFKKDWHGGMSPHMYDQFGHNDFGGNYGRNHGFGGNHFGHFGNGNDMMMMRQMEERMREMEFAFKHMDQCMEEMNSDYRSMWKDSNRFNSCNSYNSHNSYNNWDCRSNEAEFHRTLKNGEFFEKWHYQDQRMWRLEHFCMEMAKRMNFMEMETQMQSTMNNHDSMFSTSGSWMCSNRGNDYMFSKMGSYGFGNNYGSGGNFGNNMNNMNNWSITPPSGGRRNPSRPAFANRYSNYSNGMYSKNRSMYDDDTSSRYDNYSQNNRFGNYSNGMRGSRFGAMYDDGFTGMSNRFGNYMSGNNFGSNFGGMYNRFRNNFGSNFGGMYGSKFGGAMYDDGFSGMGGSKYGGMSNMYGSNFRGRMY